MSFRVDNPTYGFQEAAADYRTKQYHAVRWSTTANTFVLCSVAGERADGILLNDPNTGDAGSVQVSFVAPAKYGGTVARDDRLTTDAQGRLVTSTAQGDYICAIALEAGAVDEIHPVDLIRSSGGVQTPFSWQYSIALASIADGDVLTGITPGFRGQITSFSAIPTTVATTAAKTATLNLEINTTNLTGGVLTLTSANQGTLGVVTESTAITGANVFDENDTISVEASAVTAFVEGVTTLWIRGRVLR